MKNNKTLGLIGGLGPASTIDYYRDIIEKFRLKNGNYPNIIINSVDMEEMMDLLNKKDYTNLKNKFIQYIIQLKDAKCDFIAIASNTPHIIIEDLKKESSLPINSIVDSSVNYGKEKGYKNVLLTGTSFTMENDFYKNAFKKENINCITPNKEGINIIQNIIYPDLENGIIKEGKKEEYLEVVNKIIEKEDVDCLALACTELPLLIKEEDIDLPLLNTTKVHINSILKDLEK